MDRTLLDYIRFITVKPVKMGIIKRVNSTKYFSLIKSTYLLVTEIRKINIRKDVKRLSKVGSPFPKSHTLLYSRKLHCRIQKILID